MLCLGFIRGKDGESKKDIKRIMKFLRDNLSYQTLEEFL